MARGKREAGKPAARRPKNKTPRRKRLDYSQLVSKDIRPLLWVVTVGGLLLAFYCVRRGFTGALPWISSMVGLPWTAYGTVCSFYLNMAKSDHKEGGVTYEAAKANGFRKSDSVDSPKI